MRFWRFIIVIILSCAHLATAATPRKYFIKLGQSWALDEGVEKNWQRLTIPAKYPQNLVFISNRELPEVRIAFSVAKDKKITAKTSWQQICKDRKAFDEKSTGAYTTSYEVMTVDHQKVCVVKSSEVKSTATQTLLLPGQHSIAQLSLFFPSKNKIAQEQIASLVQALRYLP